MSLAYWTKDVVGEVAIRTPTYATGYIAFTVRPIGNEDIPSIDIAVADQDLPMLLGADFLRSHRTLVSHRQQKMYFTYTGGPVFVARQPAAAAGERETTKTQ